MTLEMRMKLAREPFEEKNQKGQSASPSRKIVSAPHCQNRPGSFFREMKARKSTKAPAFVLRAERALRRAAHNVKTQNRALNLPVIVWQDGKVVEKPA